MYKYFKYFKCRSVTYADLQCMIFANLDSFLKNEDSIDLFRSVGDTNSIGQYWLKLYNTCHKILYNVNFEESRKLIEFSLSYRWEIELESAVNMKNEEKLRKCLKELMVKCKFNIENSHDYYKYKKVLR